MSVDGIWKVEILGPYGWEAVSTAFLENGRYLSASQDHYTLGRYEVSENNIRVVAVMHPHGQSGNSSNTGFANQEFGFEGQVNGDHIAGQADGSDARQTITIRGTRLANLP